jgi:hypothetical protein
MLNDDLGEDHVGIIILYCPCDISTMSIWRWALSHTILHGHYLKALLKSYDDNNIFDVDVEGTICLKKKKNTFHKRKRKALDVDVLMSRINKLLFEESIRTIGTTVCCSLNCCQYFLCKKIALMKEEFWKMLYENKKAYGLDIPQQLHLRVDVKK